MRDYPTEDFCPGTLVERKNGTSMYAIFRELTDPKDTGTGLAEDLLTYGKSIGIIVSSVPDSRSVEMPWVFVVCTDVVGWSWLGGSSRFSKLSPAPGVR
jgi:hypothetical protein